MDTIGLVTFMLALGILIVGSFTSEDYKVIRRTALVGCVLLIVAIVMVDMATPDKPMVPKRDYQITVDKYIILWDDKRMVDTIGTLDLDSVIIKDNL